jgi:hypothetical protein
MHSIQAPGISSEDPSSSMSLASPSNSIQENTEDMNDALIFFWNQIEGLFLLSSYDFDLLMSHYDLSRDTLSIISNPPRVTNK